MPESCSTIQRDLNMLEKWAEDQQREIQSPAFEEEQLHALVVHAGDRAAVKQLGRGPEGPAVLQVEHEKVMCTCAKEG